MADYNITKRLLQNLFEPEGRRLNGALLRLNQSNKEIQKSIFDGFTFEGQFHVPLMSVRNHGAGSFAPLHVNLTEDMRRYLADKKQITVDRQEISQAILQLTEECSTEQDVRDALPECLIGCLEDFPRLSRQREEAYTIQDKPRALRQYQKVLPRMEIYSAGRLLY